MTTEYFIMALKEELLRRQRNNPNYSLRAFSRDIGLDSAVVSQVLKGRRRVPKKMADLVADSLGLNPLKRRKFVASIMFPHKDIRYGKQITIDDPLLLEEERNYKIISEWEHYALFELIDTVDFSSDPKWISKRLSISPLKVQDVIDRLIEANIIVRLADGKLEKKVTKLTTSQDVPSSALQEAHRKDLEMAWNTLESLGVDDRYFSSTTIAIDKSKLLETKELYREFRERMHLLHSSGDKNEVYQFCFQAFPLSDSAKDAVANKKDRKN